MLYQVTDQPHSVLLVSNNQAINDTVTGVLQDMGHRYDTILTGNDIVDRASSGVYDIAIIDIVFLVVKNATILRDLRRLAPDMDIILVTASGMVNIAVEFMKEGVYDFITRPVNPEHLKIVLGKTIERRDLVRAARERDLYRHMATIDGLTGLYNHKYFQEALAREIELSQRRSRDLSLMLLDIDDFKKINDHFGHQAGDAVLRDVSAHIAASCREYDTLARYGGEEFSIILPGISVESAARVADRILHRVAESRYQSVPGRVTASIGIAAYPHHSAAREDLIQKADAALYCSKERGKNTYTLYTPTCEATIM